MSVRPGKRRGVGGGGAPESKDEQHSKDGEERISLHRLTKSPTCFLKEGKGDVSFPSLRVVMIRVGRGEHIKCMTHKCVCVPLCPTNALQRGLHPLLQEGWKKKKKEEKKRKRGNFVLYLVWLSN